MTKITLFVPNESHQLAKPRSSRRIPFSQVIEPPNGGRFILRYIQSVPIGLTPDYFISPSTATYRYWRLKK